MPTDAMTREMRRVDYEQRLKIDRHSLDEALIQQGELFYQVSHAYTLAVSQRDATKEKLRRLEAQLWIATREDLERQEERVTESMVAKTVELVPEYQKARKRLLVHTQEADLWQALKEAYVQRGYVLKDLCGLFVSNYYAENSSRGPDSRSVVDAGVAERRAAIAAKRKKVVRR